MDEFIRYIVSEWKKPLISIVGIFFPAFFFLFIYNRELFLQMDSIKLVLLTITIDIFLLVLNLFSIAIAETPLNVANENSDIDNRLIYSVFISDMELLIVSLYKKFYLSITTNLAITIIIIISVISTISLLIRVLHCKKKENSRNKKDQE